MVLKVFISPFRPVNTLMQMGFGLKWRAWVKGINSTTKCSVLVNGTPTRELRMENGVWQGDPLAPFLFIIAAEGLNVALREAQRNNLFKGIRFENSEEEVALLQFADDAIIMEEWNPGNAKNLLRVLKCFEGVSVMKDEVRHLAQWLGCKEQSFPFMYLGFLVGGNMSKISSWQPLIEKFKSWLSNWKANQLSIGGRLCLCKAVGSLGTYFFSLYKAPTKVLNTLESIRRRWWWREKLEPNALWKSVVSSCSGVNNRSNGVWNRMHKIEVNLEDGESTYRT
ncbi:hypothetical protein OSB04_000510 [Centaurea solstitialis]|uniref:Reverse transcriptase domain-containing protein n=1 Tax=Centaurea solstitialis TaxID=347529 RepID=A0AA38WTW4_9ASTR|nr:hypothetical protein OSB04_000510 [Centaurea solstitialis]